MRPITANRRRRAENDESCADRAPRDEEVGQRRPRGPRAAARVAGVGALAAAVVACAAGPEYFRPTERATGHARSGAQAAIYPIDTPEGRLGEVSVWASPGAYEGADRTVVHLVAELENTSGRALALDLGQVWLEGVQVDAGQLPRVPLSSASGDGVAEATSVERVDLYFQMPAGVSPHALDAFRLHWTVTADGQPIYSQFTPFVEDEDRERYAYAPSGTWDYGVYSGYSSAFYGPFHDPYYDPFFYPRPYAYYYPYRPHSHYGYGYGHGYGYRSSAHRHHRARDHRAVPPRAAVVRPRGERQAPPPRGDAIVRPPRGDAIVRPPRGDAHLRSAPRLARPATPPPVARPDRILRDRRRAR